MPWCVFTSLEWRELLHNCCCSSPLRNRDEAGNTLLFLQHNAFPSKMEELNQMTNGNFPQKHSHLCQGRRKCLVKWNERTCFRRASLKVLKENKPPWEPFQASIAENEIKYWVVWSWNNVCAFSGEVSQPNTVVIVPPLTLREVHK